MQKIIPSLWFDTNAEEAVKFYTSIFPEGKIGSMTHYTEAGFEIHKMPAGTVLTVDFEIAGYKMLAMNGGPIFKLNPSISFMLNFDPSKDSDAVQKLDALWTKLSEGGQALMPLQEYPFSKRYGWIQDKYGLSWQLMLTNPEGEPRPFIIPSLLFTQNMAGKAEEATDLYLSVFKDSKRGQIARYPAGMEPDKEGTVMFTDFMLENQWFAAMDSAHKHEFTFNEALSLMVMCDTQEEIDAYWGKLSAVPASEQCGWLKDAYGVSWQITPRGMEKMLNDPDKEKANRAMNAMLQMKKIDIAALERAYNGE